MKRETKEPVNFDNEDVKRTSIIRMKCDLEESQELNKYFIFQNLKNLS